MLQKSQSDELFHKMANNLDEEHQMTTQPLTYDLLRNAVRGDAAAFRSNTTLLPAGGNGDKVFPPTYEGGKYATEERLINGQRVPCVILDSVPSQANRMELALLDAWERKQIELPVLRVNFDDEGLEKPITVTSLDAPHRIADAIFRDSLINGVEFDKSECGKALHAVSQQNATPLLDICPSALLFGMWHSTGKKGGLGAKLQRSIVSEIVGINAVAGVKTSSRIDPLAIMAKAGPVYETVDGDWTLNEAAAKKEKCKAVTVGKDGKPSNVNHGNIPPTIEAGGFTIAHALQTVVLSLPSIRKLRFPVKGQLSCDADLAGQTLLAAMGIFAAALAQHAGFDLRSRCFLVPDGMLSWELIRAPEQPQLYSSSTQDALAAYQDAVAEVRRVQLPWRNDPIEMTPSVKLLDLVRRSQALAVSSASEEG